MSRTPARLCRSALLLALLAAAAGLGGCDKCGHVDFTLHPKPHACAAA